VPQCSTAAKCDSRAERLLRDRRIHELKSVYGNVGTREPPIRKITVQAYEELTK
jgi:hypothetical protein